METLSPPGVCGLSRHSLSAAQNRSLSHGYSDGLDSPYPHFRDMAFPEVSGDNVAVFLCSEHPFCLRRLLRRDPIFLLFYAEIPSSAGITVRRARRRPPTNSYKIDTVLLSSISERRTSARSQHAQSEGEKSCGSSHSLASWDDRVVRFQSAPGDGGVFRLAN